MANISDHACYVASLARRLDGAGTGQSENMQRAWMRVKANQGAPGIDGMRIEDFAEFARSNWPAIRQALCDGSFNTNRSDGP